jgi:hypothetical protein
MVLFFRFTSKGIAVILKKMVLLGKGRTFADRKTAPLIMRSAEYVWKFMTIRIA